MITVQIKKDKEKNIKSFSLNGHAGFDEFGKDIVCSAVSAVTNMTLIGLYEKLSINISVDKEESGFLSCTLPDDLDASQKEKAQFLLECMVEELKDIGSAYKKNLKIIEK